MSVSGYANCTGAKLTFKSAIASTMSATFIAFLTDYSQTFASEWNTEQVFGRNDPIAMFKATRRTISLAWDIPAESASQAISNHSKTKRLIKMLYPAYQVSVGEGDSLVNLETNQQTLGKPPLVKIKYANLIRNSAKTSEGLLGWIDNLSIKPVLDMGYFHDGGALYPKVSSISLNFNVLHQHALGFSSDQSSAWLGGKSFPF